MLLLPLTIVTYQSYLVYYFISMLYKFLFLSYFEKINSGYDFFIYYLSLSRKWIHVPCNLGSYIILYL